MAERQTTDRQRTAGVADPVDREVDDVVLNVAGCRNQGRGQGGKQQPQVQTVFRQPAAEQDGSEREKHVERAKYPEGFGKG